MLHGYIQEFLDFLKNIRGYSLKSVKTYEIALLQMEKVSHFYDEDGVKNLDITPWRIQIRKQNSKTISKKLSAVHSFVKFMDEQKQIPIRLIGDGRIKVAKTLPKPIDKRYIDEAIDAADMQTAIIIELIYALGLRISELENLKRSDIKEGWVSVVGKGNKMRNIPLLARTQNKLKRYLQQYDPKTFLLESDGKRLSQNSIRYRLEKVFHSLGLKVTPHQLRHSFATDLLENGARIKDVSELLGHESLSSTQIYTKLSKGKKMQTYLSAHPLCTEDS